MQILMYKIIPKKAGLGPGCPVVRKRVFSKVPHRPWHLKWLGRISKGKVLKNREKLASSKEKRES